MSGPSEPAAAKVVDGEVFDVETEGPALVDGSEMFPATSMPRTKLGVVAVTVRLRGSLDAWLFIVRHRPATSNIIDHS